VTGHSRDLEYWDFMDQVQPHLMRPHLVALDAAFTLEEIQGAMRKLHTHKAPGGDGIPAELLKAGLIVDEEEEGPSPML